VEPLAATFGPGGSVLLRGQSGAFGEEVGLTAQVNLDGTVGWERSDAEFGEAEGFVGRYVGASGPIVWSGSRQRVLIFSEASFDVAPVSQGTTLFDFNGQLRSPSVLFGTEYVGATLADALVRPDGLFLVYYLSQNDVGARFFVYDGLETIQAWRPEGGDWTQRIVHRVSFDPAGHLVLLWSAVGAPDSAGRLTKLDPEGKLLWEVDLAGAIEVEDPESGASSLGRLELPQFMVTASEEIVLLRRAGGSFVFDVRASSDGSPLGFTGFGELTDELVFDLDFLTGSERTYLVSTASPEDPGFTTLLQVQLQLNDESVEILDPDAAPEPEEPGAGGNNGEAPRDEGSARAAAGCACETPGRPPGFAGGLALLPLGLLIYLSRRR
jgi:hypothetical protein